MENRDVTVALAELNFDELAVVAGGAKKKPHHHGKKICVTKRVRWHKANVGYIWSNFKVCYTPEAVG
jgi:hypothetical protein